MDRGCAQPPFTHPTAVETLTCGGAGSGPVYAIVLAVLHEDGDKAGLQVKLRRVQPGYKTALPDDAHPLEPYLLELARAWVEREQQQLPPGPPPPPPPPPQQQQQQQ
ncbi:hypothetical protein GPECTOR_10g772 [Gonium pectorale]|uniref:Uncharacterized protein n=1 Tax=Gonium pectorale TaxID=33097 RepID=A0A150GQS9_GONPE|nr:hypothetical protein GPECTOR_10g772 [Gonium pectorale]|eukprot:KXZ52143.1 hypothetical protein GPECTOR_10g772 [Gonium pectorale]